MGKKKEGQEIVFFWASNKAYQRIKGKLVLGRTSICQGIMRKDLSGGDSGDVVEGQRQEGITI